MNIYLVVAVVIAAIAAIGWIFTLLFLGTSTMSTKTMLRIYSVAVWLPFLGWLASIVIVGEVASLWATLTCVLLGPILAFALSLILRNVAAENYGGGIFIRSC
ncbi:MAG: hypothetical protein WAQ22_04045 [Candidatus Saccharimonas sp.]